MPHKGYTDDPAIADDAELWRRIPPNSPDSPNWVIFDEKRERWRPSSGCFKGDEMSVALADIVIGSGGTAKAYLADHEAYGLASITAGLARSSKPPQGVCPDPGADQPAHALVVGPKTDSVRRRFAVKAEWVIKPPNLETKP